MATPKNKNTRTANRKTTKTAARRSATTRLKSPTRTSRTRSTSRGLKSPTKRELLNCTSTAELAQLIEEAFASLSVSENSGAQDKRKTPRITLKKSKKMLLVSFEHDGKECTVGRKADLVDISAEGLGVMVTKAIPLGATVRFALQGETGEPDFGFARVVRTTRRKNKHWLGLTFLDNMESLDQSEANLDEQKCEAGQANKTTAFERFRRKMSFATRRLISGHRAVRTVTRSANGRRGTFRVEVRMFHYQAALEVDGHPVAFSSWPLRADTNQSNATGRRDTSIQLEGDGFCGKAALRDGQIDSCELDASADATSQRIFTNRGGFDPATFNIELGPPRNQAFNDVGEYASTAHRA